MMVKFLLLALSVEIVIAILVIFSTKSTTAEMLSESSSYVEQRLKKEMTVVAEYTFSENQVNMNIQYFSTIYQRSMAHILQSTLFSYSLIASSVSESINMSLDSDYKQFFPQTCSISNFLNPAASSSSRDFSTFAFLMIPQPTICSSSGSSQNYEDIVSLNNVIPSFLTSQTRDYIRRISIHYIDKQDSTKSFLRAYPKDALKESYNINQSPVMNRFSSISTLNSQFIGQDRILISGPDYDSKKKCDYATPCELLLSLSKITSLSANTFYITEIELFMNIFEDIFGSLSYKTSIEFCVIREVDSSNERKVAYAPEYWNVVDDGSNSNLDFFYSKVIAFSGLNQATFTNLIGSSQSSGQTKVQKKNAAGQTKEYLVNVIRMNGSILQNANLGYLDSNETAEQASPPGFDILIFGESNEMLDSSNAIKTLTLKQEYATIVIGVISGFITLIIVLFVTYCVASKLAQPLRRLIKVVKRLNNNTMQKPKVMEESKKETQELLESSEYQVADLITSFQRLIETVEAKGKENKSGEEVRAVDYPLNQFEQSFVEKAKGRSDINWKALGKLIENEPKFSQKK